MPSTSPLTLYDNFGRIYGTADNPMFVNDGSAPGSDGFSITPSDTNNFVSIARSLYVGVAGDVAVVTPAGTVLVHKGVQAGAILPIMARRINATGTTASSIIGYL